MATTTQQPVEHKFGLEQNTSSPYSPQQIPADELPPQSTLDACADLTVYDVNGKAQTFRSLYENNGPTRRTLVIFIRHFFCGLCQDYLRALSSEISAKELGALEFPTDIKIIGCGSYELIKEYVSTTQCAYPLYADRTRKLYGMLDMSGAVELGKRPEYQAASMLNKVFTSVGQVLGSGTAAFKGGNYLQIGGEFLFHNGQLVWCHRMRSTRDHTETKDLRKLLGLS